MKVSKKDIFGNPIRETTKETQEKFEVLTAKLNNSHELSKLENENLFDDIAVLISQQSNPV